MSAFDEWHRQYMGITPHATENGRLRDAFNAGLEAAAQHIVDLYPSYGSLSHLQGLAEEIRALKEKS